MSDVLRYPGAPLWVALLIVLLAILLAARSLVPPEPVPRDAPPETFSGERAADRLADLLGDETPHPVGSDANRAVRDRLLGMLRELGLDPHVQRAIGCSHKWPVCARVENVIAEIPGTTSSALAMMAHYDSVPHAPGAADDGSGVVTLLESARALLTEAPRRNRILLVFTDAEEMGLLGAEAFFTAHPLAAGVKAVINVEGSGSGGPSLLLRSSGSGGRLLDAYRTSAVNPVAFSYSQEVFARMPNDTDFTVPDRAGIASIDFAFAFEYNHYHTPLDTLANLDTRTLQHHGDNVLPLARTLAAQDLSQTAPNFAYLTLGQRFWLTWPSGWTLGLAVLGLLALGAAVTRTAWRDGWAPIGAGTLLSLLAVLLGAGGCVGALWIAAQIVGTTVSFPANPWPWRILMLAGAFGPAGLLAWWSSSRIPYWPRYLGVWIVLGCLAMTLAIVAPLAANLLLVPVLLAALMALLALFVPGADTPITRGLAACIALLVIAYIMSGIAIAMEQTQGLRLAPVVYANLLLIAPMLLSFRSGARLPAALLAGIPLAWGWAAMTPLYSDWRPQHVSLLYVLDQDARQAHWSLIAGNPLPGRIVDALGGEPNDAPVVPWTPGYRFPAAPAPSVPLPSPGIIAERVGEQARIVVQSRGTGDFAQLVLPAASGISRLTIDGHPVAAVERDGYVRASFYANGREPVTFEFTVTGAAGVEGFVIDGSHHLPAAADPIVSARGSLAVPQHQGDQSIVFRRVRL